MYISCHARSITQTTTIDDGDGDKSYTRGCRENSTDEALSCSEYLISGCVTPGDDADATDADDTGAAVDITVSTAASMGRYKLSSATCLLSQTQTTITTKTKTRATARQQQRQGQR